MGIYGAKLGETSPPNGAIYVALNGDDHADGGISTPVGSLGEALRRIPDHGYVAVYGDTFENHENVAQPWRKNVTISSLPGEQAKFLGSVEVTDWIPHAEGIWKTTGWVTNFDPTPASPSMVDDSNIMATHPEQVWVGGRPLRQRYPDAEMGPGEFWYDQINRVMFISKDPEEGVRIANKSLFLTGNQDNQTGNHPYLNLRNISVEEWGTESTKYGAVRVYGHNSAIVNCIFRGCSAAGLFVQLGRGITLVNDEFRECGQLGVHGYKVEDLSLFNCVIADNNLKGVLTWTVAGGGKFDTRSKRLRAKFNYIARNRGHGLWLDLHSNQAEVAYNVGKDHRGYAALYFEMGEECKALSNWLEGNTVGFMSSEAGQVEVAYNTLVNNTKHVRVQRGLRPSDPAWLPFNHEQYGFDIHSNLYVQTIPDPHVAFNSYEDSHGAAFNWQEVGWESNQNVIRRVPGSGYAAVLTTSARQRQGFPTIGELRAIGHDADSQEVIADGIHSSGSINKAGRPMSNACKLILGVEDLEAQEPNIGWYGPEYVPDPEEEEDMTLAQELHDIANEVATLETELSTCEEQVVDLQGQLATANSTITAREATIADLEQLNEELVTVNVTLNGTITEREARIADLNEAIDELNERLSECDCPEPEPEPVGLEERLAPLRGTCRYGWAAKPGTLAAYQSVENLIGTPGESRRIFASGDVDWTVDTAANRVPYVEVPIGSNYEAFVETAVADDKPVVFTIGHEEERPDKGHTPTWFKENYEEAFSVLQWAPKAVIIHTWMNQSARTGTVNGVPFTDWLPPSELAHGIGFDIYVGNPLNQPFNSHANVLNPALAVATQLGLPMFIGEFAVGGPMQQRAAWVVGLLQWIQQLHAAGNPYAPLIAEWFHSNVGSNPPLTFDGTNSWEINKASDQVDTQTPAIWSYGIQVNGA